ncbi:MAG: hypothetical protein KDA79_04755 [Planctomycetaceae bacterium]|nr:hypothetical protein [Planctomycetaceae bacterium]
MTVWIAIRGILLLAFFLLVVGLSVFILEWIRGPMLFSLKPRTAMVRWWQATRWHHLLLTWMGVTVCVFGPLSAGAWRYLQVGQLLTGHDELTAKVSRIALEVGLLTSGLLLVAWGLAHTRLRLYGTAVVMCTLSISVAFYSPLLAFQAFAVFFFSAVCSTWSNRPITMLLCSAPLCWLFAWPVFEFRSAPYRYAQPRLELRQEIREEFPVVSLDDRLRWESPSLIAAGKERSPVIAPIPLSNVVLTDLRQLEERRRGYRQLALEDIHSRTQEEFLSAPDFGVYRMHNFQRKDVELNDASPVVLPDPPPARPAPSFAEAADLQEAIAAGEQNAGPPEARTRLTAGTDFRVLLKNVYRNGLADFSDPDEIGWVPQRKRAAGFTPHRMDKVPDGRSRHSETGHPEFPAGNTHNWQITRLELVSLLKHAEPVVYESRELPRMDRLANAPTRPLTGFERRSLRELRGREDLVTEEKGGRVLMLGAIRAAKQCLNCHDVRRGTLLGAFSYEIWLPGAAPVEAQPSEDLPPAT